MGTHPIFESDFDCLTDEIMSDRFATLSVEDKLRLQALIKELTSATKDNKQKEEKIKDLEGKLNNEVTLKKNVESKNEKIQKELKYSQKEFHKFKKSLMSRQNEVSDKIDDAKRKITDLKHQRSKEKKIFRERERRLKEQLDHQHDIARACEQRAEEVQEELKKYATAKTSISAQTSFMIQDNQESISDLHITSEEKLPTKSSLEDPKDPELDTSVISVSEQLRKEQKQLDELMEQQNRLLEQAKMFRERVDEKLALHESFKSSRNDSKRNNEKTGTEESFLNDISFQSLPKISPRSQASVDIAALIDKIDDVDQELRGIPDDTIKLVELIDELDFEETLSQNQNQSASTSFSASQTSQFEFDPLLEDIFFK